jgi:lipoate-protein ligase B
MVFKIFDLGLADFQKALDFQKETHSAIKNNGLSSALILCRHYPVITLGRAANKKNILVSKIELEKRGIAVYEIERGGDVTYHGPGQLMAYPVFNLNYLKKDIHWFLRQLEETVITYLPDLGIKGERQPGLTGVWVDGKKISSIGIAIRNWITFHGLSINIKNGDLANFRLIRPCGMDIEMVTLETLLGRNIEIESVKENLIHKFREIFSCQQIGLALSERR